MRNLIRYNRILARGLAAALVVTNLGANAQTVLASEVSTEMIDEAVAAVPETVEEPVTQEIEASEPVTETEVSESTVETPNAEPSASTTEVVDEIDKDGSVTETTTSDSISNTDAAEKTNTEESSQETEEVSEETSEKVEETTEKVEKTTEKVEKTEEADEAEEIEDEHDELWYYIHERDCTEEHDHTDDCYKVVRELDCTEDHAHTKDCYRVIEEVISIVEYGDVETVIYTASTSGIKVQAEAVEGTLPEGASLKASRIESTHELAQVAEELDHSNVEYDDYLALDVYFENADGEEIEPEGSVAVTFELEDSVLPEEAVADSLSVQHFDESGSTTEVVTVADAGDSTSGTISADKAEFEVYSFSTFTITWYNSKSDTETTTEVTVKCVDEDGNELPATALPEGLENLKLELASGNTFKLDSKTKENLAIDGYTFVSANTENVSDVYSIKATYTSKTEWDWNKWDRVTTYYWSYETYKSSDTRRAANTSTTAPVLTLVYHDNNKKTGSTDASFYIILDGGGTLPLADGNRTDGKKGSSDKPDEYIYSARPGIQMTKALMEATAVYDINDSNIVNQNSATYADNSVAANLAQIPSNEQIKGVINGTGSLKYEVTVNSDGLLEVTNVNKAGGQYTIDGLAVGDTLYVNWYVIKDCGSDGWHVDGELLIYTHHEEPKVGNLKVSLSTPDDTTQAFNVNVALSYLGDTRSYKVATYDANGKVGERMVDFSNAVDFTLKDGEYIIINDLPEGAAYTVTESEQETFDVTYYNNGSKVEAADGSIVDDETQVVSIENARKIVITGVDLGSHPVEAAAAVAAVMIVFGAAYVMLNRRYR